MIMIMIIGMVMMATVMMMVILFIKQDELFNSGKSKTRLWSHQQGPGEF